MKQTDAHIFTVNKAKVIFTPVRGLETVVIYVYIKAGLWYETKSQVGLFHLLEHCIHNQTKRFSSLANIEEYKQFYGIRTNAVTEDSTVYFVFSFPRRYFKQALELMRQYLFEAEFNAELLVKESQIIKQEFLSHQDNAYFRFNKIWYQRLFGKNHTYTRAYEYSTRLLDTYQISDLQKVYTKHFQPQHMVFGIAGNLKPSSVNHDFEAILEQYPNSGTVKEVSIGKIKTDPISVNVHDTFDTTSIAFAWVIPANRPLSPKDKIIHNIARFLLADSANHNSYLLKRVRHETRLAYSAGLSLAGFPKHDLLAMWAYCDVKNIRKIKQLMKESVDEALMGKLTKKELHRVIRFYNIRSVLENDSVANLAYYPAVEFFYDNTYTPLSQFEQISKTVQPKDITRYLTSFLALQPPHVATLYKK